MFSLVVALDENKGIGKDNVLPWHIKEDLKLFKQNTLNHKIVMGITTFSNLPRKLVDRYPIVVTKKIDYHVDDPDVTIEHDLLSFLQKHQNDDEEYIICGGASIYRQSYPYCKKAYVSFVKGSYQCDTFFDNFDINDFKVIKEEAFEEFIYQELERI